MLLDIILIIFLASLIGYGYKKGAVDVVAHLASIIIAFILAYFLARTVGDYIAESTIMGKNARASGENNITELMANDKSVGENGIIGRLVEITRIDLSNSRTIIAAKLTDYIFIGIGFGAVYFITRIILWIAAMMLDGIFELPVLKTFNKLGGVIAGIVMFLIETGIIFAVIYFASSFDFMKGIIRLIDSSVIASTIYNHNIITDLLLSKIF